MADAQRLDYDLLIAGRAVKGDNERITVTDPATGAAIGSVANASPVDAVSAVAAAHQTGPTWAAVPPRERSEILRKCWSLMMRDRERLARLISLENGKALKDAAAEVNYAAEFFRWFAEEAVRIGGDFAHAPSGANNIVVQHSPIGVSLLITPWNYPAAMATRKIAPAIAAGCTCVLKPATETPLTAYAVAELMAEAGLPDGVVNIVTSSTTAAIVDAMLEDGRVRKVSFTGSTGVGRVLLRKAADTIANCSMELGGNAPFIVFDDANLEAALEGAIIAKMRNGGEACTAANRFYIQRGIASAFARALADRMAALKVGPGSEPGVDLGPLVNIATADKVASLVDDAVAKGARVLTGGKKPANGGCFYEPTVLMDVPDTAIMRSEEIFGPVAPIYVFDTEDEVVERANDTEYGLISYVYTSDLTRGFRVGQRLECGMLGLNRGLVSDPAAPFGGVKQSGLGREGGHHGIMEYLEPKYIAVSW